MAKTIEAVYENGVFRPLEPVQLKEGQCVQVYVPWAPPNLTAEEALAAAAEVQKAFADMTEEEWAEVQQSWKRGP